MPYPRNPEREERLLNHYLFGHTIQTTSFITNIPAGSISYYFRKFKKNPEYYMTRRNAQIQPKKSKPSEEVINEIVNAQTYLQYLYSIAIPLIQEKKYADARNFLESTKILKEHHKELNLLQKSATPEQIEKAQKIIFDSLVEPYKIMQALSALSKITDQEETLTARVRIALEETPTEVQDVAQKKKPKFKDLNSMVSYYLHEEIRKNPENAREIVKILNRTRKNRTG